MRPIRVGDATFTIGPLACMRCGRKQHREFYGIERLPCDGKQCRASWLALRLPPGTTGQQIVELYGEAVADALHRAVCPNADGCSQDALRAWILPIPSTGGTYLQRLPDTPEPLVGWLRADSMLRSLMGAR